MSRPDRPTGPARVLANLARLLGVLTWPFIRYDIRRGCADEVTMGVAASNHRSMFDGVAVLVCLHRLGQYPRVLIEQRYVDHGWTGPALRALGAIPVDRTGAPGTALDQALQALRDGVGIGVMPEGRLHWDPQHPMSTGPAKTGVSRLAVGGGVPVIPVGLSGTERVLPPGSLLPRLNPFRRKVIVLQVADEPLWLDAEDHEANTARVMAAIEDLLRRAALPPDPPAQR